MLGNTAPIIVDAAIQHSASMIFLHGLGDTGYGWIPVMRQLAKKFRFMKFICPNAPNRKVTLNGGMVMPAWYDIYSLNERDDREDELGIKEAATTVIDLVRGEQAKGIPLEQIFIGGNPWGRECFASLMHQDLKLGGVISLSAYLPCKEVLKRQKLLPITTPIFMAHGTADFVVQYSWHQRGVEFLKSLGGQGAIIVEKTYKGMDHTACEEEIVDLAEFIEDCINSKKTRSEL